MHDKSKDDDPRGGWRFAPLITSFSIVAIFVATWLHPATRGSWDRLDLLIFRSLNNTLATGEVWQRFWAICNWRGFDAMSGIVVLAVLINGIRRLTWKNSLRPWISLAVLAASILLTRQLVNETLIDGVMEYHRPSPTVVLDRTWRLSQLAPDIPCKDSSPYSFPGDHGFILITLALYVSYWAKQETVHWAWWSAGLFTLPRLVSGAHWFTDIAIGSASMALVTTAVLMATPLHDRLVQTVLQLVERGGLGRTTSTVDATDGLHESGFSPTPTAAFRRRRLGQKRGFSTPTRKVG